MRELLRKKLIGSVSNAPRHFSVHCWRMAEAVEEGIIAFSEADGRARMVELGWHKLFDEPSLWWDCRNAKRTPTCPDFVHTATREALWIDSPFCPHWVQSALTSLHNSCAGLPSPAFRIRYRKLAAATAAQGGNLSHKPFPPRNHSFWTNLISHHAKSGQERKALAAYKQMRELGITPRVRTLVVALQACTILADLQTGKEIHAHATEIGNDTHMRVANTLVHMYAKCDNLVKAHDFFDQMQHHDVVSWTALMMGYVQKDKGEPALRLYDRMQDEGIEPNARTFVVALKACASLAAQEESKETGKEPMKIRCLKKGKVIHSQAAASGFDTDVFVANTLIDMYVKCGSMLDALRVFEFMLDRDVVSWNAIIAGYAQMEMGEFSLQLYTRMQHEGCTPDARTFVAALKACGNIASRVDGKQSDRLLKQACLEKGRTIHFQLTNSGFEAEKFVANTLVDMYAKCGSMMDASNVFERMPHHDVVSWTAMIMGYVQMEKGELALKLYARMQHEGFTPDARTFVAVLKACGSLAAEEEGKQAGGCIVKVVCLEKGRNIHSQVAIYGLESDLFVASALVCMYVKCGSMVDARQVFEKMTYHDLVLWNAMIMGYTQAEEAGMALQLYRQMMHKGFRPDTFTFVAALKACSSLAFLETGKEIHDEIRRVGVEGDEIVTTCLIDMYGKCGSMVDAQHLFDTLPARSVIKWSALITGYGDQGDTQRVFSLFEKMQQEGIRPDGIVFVSLLNVCSHAGLVDRGQVYFHAMCSDITISPSNEHYRCMVDLLGRAGHLDEALMFLKKMPFKLDILSWITILSSCHKWNNVEVARHAFECAMRLDYKQATAYVLMTNIYASAHMWEECIEIQELKSIACA